MKEHINLENRCVCDVQRIKSAVPTIVESSLQKHASVDYCYKTLSGAEECIKELANARVFFLHILHFQEMPAVSSKLVLCLSTEAWD